jgi:hypothetical protein
VRREFVRDFGASEIQCAPPALPSHHQADTDLSCTAWFFFPLPYHAQHPRAFCPVSMPRDVHGAISWLPVPRKLPAASSCRLSPRLVPALVLYKPPAQMKGKTSQQHPTGTKITAAFSNNLVSPDRLWVRSN